MITLLYYYILIYIYIHIRICETCLLRMHVYMYANIHNQRDQIMKPLISRIFSVIYLYK